MKTALPARSGAAPSRDAAPVSRRPAALAPAGGHSLGGIAIQPREAMPPPSPVPAPSAAPAGAVIQRAPWWKKGLAGLGLIGGGIATGLGVASIAATGLAAATTGALVGTALGGLGVLAGGGYLLHQALRTPAPGEREREALESRRSRLRGSERGSRQELLYNLLDEGLGQLGRGTRISEEPSRLGGGDTGREGGQRGRYVVKLDPAEKDPVKRQAYLLHELIHASADQSYPANAKPGRQFYNIDDSDDWENHRDRRGQEIIEGANQLFFAAEKDPHLTREQIAHVQRRMEYLGFNPNAELDTVATDLLYYFDAAGVSEDSPTHRTIVGWAREAYRRRQEGRLAQVPRDDQKKKDL